MRKTSNKGKSNQPSSISMASNLFSDYVLFRSGIDIWCGCWDPGRFIVYVLAGVGVDSDF